MNSMSGASPAGATPDHEGGRPVTEDHPRWPDVADLVRELLHAHDEHRTLHLLKDASGIGQAVGHPGARCDEVAGRMRLVDAQLTGDPGRYRGNDPGARAGADQHRPDLLGTTTRVG